MIDLTNNNFNSKLIAFTNNGNESRYCLADVEYWIGEWWSGYVDLSKGSLEDLYFQYLDRFAVEYNQLKSEYVQIIELGDKLKIDGNKPKIYIDFDLKYFVSSFYDQALERRLPKDWVGKFQNVEGIIPTAFRYWER